MKKNYYNKSGPPPPDLGAKSPRVGLTQVKQTLSLSQKMNNAQYKSKRGLKALLSVMVTALFLGTTVSGAQARVLFQDDSFHDIDSEGIIINSDDGGDEDVTFQLGNDGTDATFIFDDGTGDLSISTPGGDIDFNDENLSTTGNLDVDGNAIFNNSTQFRLREDPDPNTNAECTVLNEVILDTTDDELQICTVVGNPGTWVATAAGDADTLDSLDSTQFLRSDTSDNFTTGTLTTDAGTTLDVDGTFDASGSTAFQIREDADPATNAACATVGELILDTTDNEIQVCTATGGAGAATWLDVASGATQDFEDVYSADGDSTLTASGTFDIDATGALGLDSDADTTIGGAGVDITSDGGILSLTGDGTDDIDVSNTGANIDFDSATFELDTTAGFSVDGADASNISVATDAAAEDLTLEVTGATDSSVVVNSSGTGTDAVDINATAGGVTIDSAGATSIDAVGASNFTTDSGALTIETTTSGDLNLTGADDIVFDDGTITGTITLSDTDTDWAATFSDNGVVDVINSFTSTANGEGASNIGIEDAGGYFTGTDVEAALQELGASADNNNDVLVFYPEYPDTVVSQDGSNNRGRLDAEYDSVNDEYYYQWTSRNGTTQDIDLRFRFELPTDFTDVNDFTLRYQTGTAVGADNFVDVSLINITDASTTCASSTGNTSVTWATITLVEATIEAGCTGGSQLDAGDVVEVLIKLGDNSGGVDFARSGTIELDYDN